MNRYIGPGAFLLSTGLLLTATAVTIIVPPSPTPLMSGVDVSISALALNESGAKDIRVLTNASAPGPTGFVGIAMTTVSCNVQATQNSPYALPDWYALFASGTASNGRPSGERHPMIATNVYRLLANGRLEQVSAGWVKHSWYAASSQQITTGDPINGTGQYGCGGVNNTGKTAGGGNPCVSSIQGTQLGPNCSDTYTASHNFARYYLGPRQEIRTRGIASDPGYLQRGGYHDNMVLTGSPVGSIDDIPAASQNDNGRSITGSTTTAAQMNKLNMVSLTELSEASVAAGGKVILEGGYVVNSDVNKLNNVANRWFNYVAPASGNPNSTGADFTQSSPHNQGPALFKWPGADVYAASPNDQGSVYVGSRVVYDAQAGNWRYEYNVYNLDLDLGVWGFALPIPVGGVRSDINFRQPRQFAPAFPSTNAMAVNGFIQGFDSTPWAGVETPGQLNWAPTQTVAVNYKPNSLRWGTMYTFWFTSDQPPRSNGVVNLARSLNGTVTPVSAQVSVPKSWADIAGPGDQIGPDGDLSIEDFIVFLAAFSDGNLTADLTGSGGPPALPDGDLSIEDFITFLNAFTEG